jgi:hypothetical protein
MKFELFMLFHNRLICAAAQYQSMKARVEQLTVENVDKNMNEISDSCYLIWLTRILGAI